MFGYAGLTQCGIKICCSSIIMWGQERRKGCNTRLRKAWELDKINESLEGRYENSECFLNSVKLMNCQNTLFHFLQFLLLF